MLFPAATIAGLDCRLLLIPPAWSGGRGVSMSHRFDTSLGLGRTSIEERRARRSTLLLAQSCTLALHGTARDDWRKGLAALGTQPVAMPLWVDALPVARWAERIYEPAMTLNFDSATGDFAAYAVGDLPEDLGDLDYPLLAPLLLGRWDKRPAASVRAPAVAEVDIVLPEKRPWAWRIGIHAHGSGWSALPDWSSGPIVDENIFPLEQTQLEGAAASEPILDATNIAARWRQQAGFKFATRLAIRDALTHFESVKGARDSWSPVPAWFQPGADTTATPDDYTARFEADALTLTFASRATASASISFIQEIDTGERSQSLASEAFCYALTYQHDAGNPELFTNWDAPISGTEGTFAPDQCVHTDLLPSLRPQDARADLQLGRTANSLAADWMLGRLYGWVRLEIFAGDPEDFASTRRQVFGGFVQDVAPDGNTLTLTANFFGTALDREAPGDVFGVRCNTWLTSARCTLAEADLKTEGTIAPADLSADGRTLTIHSPAGFGDGGTGTYADHWFAPNGILRTGTGRAKMVATITASAMDDTDLVVTLNRPLWADKIDSGGQTATLIPSCEGQYEADCGTKFDNQDNFRGDPYMPDYLEQSAPAAPKVKK